MSDAQYLSRIASPTPSQLPPVPSSPVYSIASTANPIAQYNLPAPPAPRPSHPVLSKNDLSHSQEAYTDLLSTAKTYRLALAQLSTAASGFGSALESCARLKEARAEPIGIGGGSAHMTSSFTTRGSCTADTLMSASGVHHLIANHHHILSEVVYRSFEVPLLHDLDKWQTVIDDEEETYLQKSKAQSKEVKRLEKEGLKLHKQRRRDVARFRAHLVQLTEKLDGLTTLHADHARTMLRESQETSGRIVDASCSLVRAEVDIFEAIARKGWSGGGLDDLLEKGQDLFAARDDDGPQNGAGGSTAGYNNGQHGSSNAETAKLFSILPPKSILPDSASEVSRRGAHHGGGGGGGGADSLLVDTERYQSLTGVASEPRAGGAGGGDNDSILSADFNKPRNARPFSPQPIRRMPMDVTIESLGGGGGGSVSGFGGVPPPLTSTGKQDDSEDEQDRKAEPEQGLPAAILEHVSQEERDEAADKWPNNSGRQTPESPRGGLSPEFVTDESSPESRWSADRGG